MNYQKIYDSLIERGKLRKKSKGLEAHHAIPKSLGGSNRRENIAYLTLREHFICHLLLVKIHEGESKSKMSWALHRMAFSGKYSSREYEKARKIHIENVSRPKTEETKAKMRKPKSEKHKENMKKAKIIVEEERRQNIRPPKIYSEEAKAKRRITLAQRYPEGLGKPHTKEAIEKIKNARKTQVFGKETRALWSKNRSGSGNGMFGRKHSEESRAKMRETRRLRRLEKSEELF